MNGKVSDSFDEDDENDDGTAPIVYRGQLFDRARDRRRLIRGMVAILVVLLAICWLVLDTKQGTSATSSELHHETKHKAPNSWCPQLCEARLKQRLKRHGGDLLNKLDLQQSFQTAKSAYVTDLKQKYGSYYDAIMLQDGAWRKGFRGVDTNGISSARFRRTLKIKVLQMQLELLQENAHLEGCNCNTVPQKQSNKGESSSRSRSRSRNRRLDPQQIVLPDLKSTYSEFIWTTGGHSASAGHGNLYNESYTAFMEAFAQPIFQSVGVKLTAKNYAMGGMRSAPEYALCQESIFGTNTNVITWDFGMTDVPNNWKQRLYMSRAGVNPGRPAVIGINIHGFDEEPRMEIMGNLEKDGMAAFYFIQDSIIDMEKVLPDMLGMNQQQIDDVPDFVRYFKCKELIEKDDPGCADHKYNEALCSNRHHKADWHPGWKVNALYGNLMAFFLIEHLEEALAELKEDIDPATQLKELQEQEDADYEHIRKVSNIPKEPIRDFLEEPVLSEVDPNMIHYDQVYCHTALTPSELRYKGILTETTEHLGILDYEQGVSKPTADKGQSTGPMRIVFDENERNPPCPVLTKVDYKDFFYSNEKDGWTYITFPNDSEIQAFARTDGDAKKNEKLKGLIMVCWLLCDWGQCPPGDVREKDLAEGKLRLKVNGLTVTETVKAAECSFLKHESGYYFPPDEKGKFKMDVLVEKSDNPEQHQYTRITSIIVF